MNHEIVYLKNVIVDCEVRNIRKDIGFFFWFFLEQSISNVIGKSFELDTLTRPHV